ncbi:MAG: AAA family ATPase [archaeon]|nr:AAA family ATPase [archaeon]
MAVLILVGLARSGKDTAADYIAEKYGYSKYTFSSVLRETLEEKGINPTKERMLELGDMLRGLMGMDAIAKLLDKKINKKDNLVLVGPRSIEEVQYFRKKYPELKVIRVVAGKAQRFARRSERDPKEEEGFFSRDERDVKTKGMQKVLDEAQLQINNFGSIEELYRETDSVMKVALG